MRGGRRTRIFDAELVYLGEQRQLAGVLAGRLRQGGKMGFDLVVPRSRMAREGAALVARLAAGEPATEPSTG